MSAVVEACDECLRRCLLVGALSPLIERATNDVPGGRARELLALPEEELVAALGRGAGARLADGGRLSPRRLRRTLEALGAFACCRHDDAYPAGLRHDRQAPAALLGLGDTARLAPLAEIDNAVTLVGARRASGYGLSTARRLGAELLAARFVVVSGMAIGIDSAAHRGALDVGDATVAVLGSGPDVPHPRRERRLYEGIVERGLVLSELPPGARPYRWTFPARNRIMAALSKITIVVEAAERSGSLITAEMANDLGRDVGAVPGQVGSTLAAGTNDLIHDGAHMIRDAGDVLDTLIGAGARESWRTEPELIDETSAAVLAEIDRGHTTLDQIAAALPDRGAEVAATLTRLELRGLVRVDLGGRYSRC